MALRVKGANKGNLPSLNDLTDEELELLGEQEQQALRACGAHKQTISYGSSDNRE